MASRPLEFVEQLAGEQPALAEDLAELRSLYERKLWHQLTLKLEELFNEFGQSADTPSTDRGVGLGLAVVRQNLGLLGGKISTRPLAPSGICFEIELPALKKTI